VISDSLRVFLLPLVVISVFALVDIVRRRDLSGAWRVTWLLVVFVPPFVGTLVYLLFRPAGATRLESDAQEDRPRSLR
jgi:hypothetical protein